MVKTEKEICYTYTNRLGVVEGRAVRVENEQGEKLRFRSELACDVNGVLCFDETGLGKHKLPMYRENDWVAQNRAVFWVEGEKCVESLYSIGYLATTLQGGAKSPKSWLAARSSDLECLKGRNVILVPDNDEDGRKYVAEIGDALSNVGAKVRIVEEKPWAESDNDKSDIADWIEAGATKEQVAALAKNATTYKPQAKVSSLVTMAADVEEVEIAYLMDEYVPVNALVMLSAQPKTGKSTVAADWCVRVAEGRAFPFSDSVTKGSALFFFQEGTYSQVKTRMTAAGLSNGSVGLVRDNLDLTRADGQRQFVETIQGMKDCKLVVLDPLRSYLNGVNSMKDNDAVREALTFIDKVAVELNVCIVGIHHDKKNNSGEGRANVAGVGEWTQVARWNYTLRRNTQGSFLFPNGCNEVVSKPAIRFRLEGQRPAYLNQVDMHIDEFDSSIMETEVGMDECSEWLRDFLTANGPTTKSDVVKAARGAYGIKKIEKAKGVIGAKHRRKDAYDRKSEYVWYIPGAESTGACWDIEEEPEGML